MANYKDCRIISIGASDMAALTVIKPDGPEFLHFGQDGSYQAYLLGDDDTLGGHYKPVMTVRSEHGTTWVRICDDDGLTFQARAREITIYRAGSFGCAIRLSSSSSAAVNRQEAEWQNIIVPGTDAQAVEPLPCTWPDDYRIRVYRADDGRAWMVNTDSWNGYEYDALPATETAPGIWEAGTERRRLRPVYRFERDGISIDGVEENTDSWSYLTAIVEIEVH